MESVGGFCEEEFGVRSVARITVLIIQHRIQAAEEVFLPHQSNSVWCSMSKQFSFAERTRGSALVGPFFLTLEDGKLNDMDNPPRKGIKKLKYLYFFRALSLK